MSEPPSEESLLRGAGELPRELRLGLERLQAKRPSAERLLAIAAACGAVASGAGTAAAASSTAGAGTPLSPAAPAPSTASLLAYPGVKLFAVAFTLLSGALLLLVRTPAPSDPAAVSGAAGLMLDEAAPGALQPRAIAERKVERIVEGARAPERGAPLAAAPGASLEPAQPPVPPPEESVSPAVAALDAVPSALSAKRADVAAARPATRAPSAPSLGAREFRPERSPPAPGAQPTSPRARVPEAELLRDARQVLESSPHVALSLCEEHQRAYPGGALAQERELIAITALLRLGRTASAEQRASRFRAAYPTSPHLTRLDRLLPPR